VDIILFLWAGCGIRNGTLSILVCVDGDAGVGLQVSIGIPELGEKPPSDVQEQTIVTELKISREKSAQTKVYKTGLGR